MSATTTDPNAVKAQTEEIVISRADIRPRLAEVVTHNAWRPQQAGGLIGLMQAVIDGALAGLAERVPQEGDDVLCQVVEGLGDGLSQTALAGQMALVEAAKCNRRYATEDVKRFSGNLLAVHDLFAETVKRGLTTCKALTTAQVAMVRTDRVARRLSTELEVLNDFNREHPEAFARKGVGAGGSAEEYPAGALFQAIDRMHQRAGTSQSVPMKREFAS